MKIPLPSVPLTIGFSANLGQNFFGPPVNYCGFNPCSLTGPSAPVVGGTAAKDDLRFFIGTQFDVGKLAAKLPSF